MRRRCVEEVADGAFVRFAGAAPDMEFSSGRFGKGFGKSRLGLLGHGSFAVTR